MSLTPTPYWLVGAKYSEKSRAATLEFSSKNARRMSRQRFFPQFFVNCRAMGLDELKRSVSPPKKRFKLERFGGAFRVSAGTFSDLNELANSLFNETGFRPLVLAPERQFLLERGFSFFDCFTFFSDQEFVKSGRFSLPKARTCFFSEPLDETLSMMLEPDSGLAEELASLVVFSNILRIPLDRLPGTDFEKGEALLETCFWNSGIGCRRKESENAGPSFKAGRGFSDSKELDFGLFWPTLLTKPFYNLAQDTVDCDCCRPASPDAKNVLPSSLVWVEFLQDGFFFESGSKSFSERFHSAMPGRESRLRRQKEFCLQVIPLGPFFRNQRVSVPLGDALRLQGKAKARVLGLDKFHWFCLKNESAVSGLVGSMHESLALLEKSIDLESETALKSNGILGSALLSKTPGFVLNRAFLKAFSELLGLLPNHLCCGDSAFFSHEACAAFEQVKARVLSSLGEFAESREGRLVSLPNGKTALKSERPFSLLKEFAESRKIPSSVVAISR